MNTGSRQFNKFNYLFCEIFGKKLANFILKFIDSCFKLLSNQVDKIATAIIDSIFRG